MNEQKNTKEEKATPSFKKKKFKKIHKSSYEYKEKIRAISDKRIAPYKEELKIYFNNHKNVLCEDCKESLEINPLRILDCKIDSSKEEVQNAPKFEEELEDGEIRIAQDKQTNLYINPKKREFTDYHFWYNMIKIPKKKNKMRIIHDYHFNNSFMKRRHQQMSSRISNKAEFFAFDGLQLHESSLKHVNSKSFISIDFSAFFDSVNIMDVFDKFINVKYSDYTKWKVLNESSDKDGFLLQGTVLAPYFANISLRDLDNLMRSRGEKEGFTYSRYADDIVISFPDIIEYDELQKLASEFEKFIIDFTDKDLPNSKVAINPAKTQVANFAKVNHYKILSFNVIKGKHGQENYVTVGRKKRRKGYNKGKVYFAYHAYQVYAYQNSEVKKNKPCKNYEHKKRKNIYADMRKAENNFDYFGDVKDQTVYHYKNMITGKSYIGITNNPNSRKNQHKNSIKSDIQTQFAKALRKYGWNSFEYEVLEENLTREEACKKEMFYIKKYNSFKDGYNATIGGDALNYYRKKEA